MQRCGVRTLLVLTILIGSFDTAVPVSASGRPAGVPVAIDEHGGIVVAVRVGDAGPFDFILDTGASRSLVADDLAEQLGAPLVARSEVVTSAGTELRGVVRLAALSAAGAHAESVIAPVVPAARLSALGPSVRGILGQDFLSAFNYTLDYRRHHLTWDAGNPCGDPGAVRLMEAEGRFVMELPQPGSRRPLRLVPDTGAEAFVLFDGQVEDALGTPDRGVTLAGLAGNRSARQIMVSRLVVGPVTLRDRRAVVVERRDENADGLLPLHEFSSVSFGARGACLVVRN
jgi:predicted aspartyl protease